MCCQGQSMNREIQLDLAILRLVTSARGIMQERLCIFAIRVQASVEDGMVDVVKREIQKLSPRSAGTYVSQAMSFRSPSFAYLSDRKRGARNRQRECQGNNRRVTTVEFFFINSRTLTRSCEHSAIDTNRWFHSLMDAQGRCTSCHLNMCAS